MSLEKASIDINFDKNKAKKFSSDIASYRSQHIEQNSQPAVLKHSWSTIVSLIIKL